MWLPARATCFTAARAEHLCFVRKYDFSVGGENMFSMPGSHLLANRCNAVLYFLFFYIAVLGCSSADAVTIAEHAVPTSYSVPWSISQGADGKIWFTETSGNKIGQFTISSGAFVEFAIPTPNSDPFGIVEGSDGSLWFVENNGNKIGRITTDGIITEFQIPTANSSPFSIVEGSDSNLWFTETGTDKIGCVTKSGAITEFPISEGSGPSGITAGPDGNLWFTEPGTDKIGLISTTGAVTEFPISEGSGPSGITTGPDGNLWFTEPGTDKIARITTSGIVTQFAIPTVDSGPAGIALGPDGNLWFNEFNGDANKVGRITTGGVITEFSIPAGSGAFGIATGPNKDLWFAESDGNKIGQVSDLTVATTLVTVSKAGTGTGTVSGQGISCGGICIGSYNAGSQITLTATADTGSTFLGWSGAGCSGTSQCLIIANANMALTATFAGAGFFSDVASNDWSYEYVKAILNAGITIGCASGVYCPSQNVTREQMAAFIIRALYGETFIYTTTPYFTDVPSTNYYFKYIQKMKDLNITVTSGSYSAHDYVTRDQMAAFLVRATQAAAGQGTENFTCIGNVDCSSTAPYFSDVPSTNSFFKYIQKLKELGITTGCGNGNYCPSEDVTRDQMAAFLASAFLGINRL
jgi:streptogramin lyase